MGLPPFRVLVDDTPAVSLEKEQQVVDLPLDDLSLVGVGDLDSLRVGVHRHHVGVHITVVVDDGVDAGEGVML